MKALLALPLALALAACGGPFGRGGSIEERAVKRAEKIASRVDADDAQRAALKQAAATLGAELGAARDDARDARAAAKAILTADAVDAAALQAEADRLAAAFAKSGHAVVDAGASAHAALSPAQRARLVQEAKPGRGARAAFWVATKLGYGPPVDAADAKERAQERVADLLDEIEATEQQRAQLEPLLVGFVDDAAPLLDRPVVVKDALLAAWSSEDPDVDALHAMIDAEAARVRDALRAGSSRLAQAHGILTPEQRATIAAKAAARGCGDDSATTTTTTAASAAGAAKAPAAVAR